MNKQTVKVQIDNIQWPDIQNLSTSCVEHILKHCKPDSKIVFDIPDTRYITKNDTILTILANKYPHCKIRVRSGLNEDINNKYNDKNYRKRTIYTPQELAEIISVYEEIEATIDPSWSDLTKALYIYLVLIINMEYGEINIKGQDVARNLTGILYLKQVCAGFALTYKELLNRSGIRCAYRNKTRIHNWNEFVDNGNIYPVDLTWDCYNYHKSGKLTLKYFGTDTQFYKNPYHQSMTEQPSPQKVSFLTPETCAQELNKIYKNLINCNRGLRDKASKNFEQYRCEFLAGTKNWKLPRARLTDQEWKQLNHELLTDSVKMVPYPHLINGSQYMYFQHVTPPKTDKIFPFLISLKQRKTY